LGVLLFLTSPRIRDGIKLVAGGGLVFLALGLTALEQNGQPIDGFLRQARAMSRDAAARGLLLAGRPNQAAPLAAAAFRDVPASRKVAWTNARVAEALGNFTEAARWLHIAVALEDESVAGEPEAISALGRYYLARGNLRGVDRCLDELRGYRGRGAGGAVLKAARLRAEAKYEEAEDAARRVLLDFQEGTFAGAYAEVAEARVGRKDWAGAAYYAMESYRHDPRLRGWAPRIPELAEQAGADPVSYRAFRTASWIRGSIGSGEEESSELADRIMSKLLEREPRFPARDQVLHSRASYQFYEKEDFESALDLYQQVIRQVPDGETWCRCVYQTARCYLELERWDPGIRATRRVQSECPGDLAEGAVGLERKLRAARREQGI
jgi:tetratricopeptide (TPR) repeat protein